MIVPASIFTSTLKNTALTKHFSVLCILCHNVQHVFGLHDLREMEQKELMWSWAAIAEHIFYKSSSEVCSRLLRT